MTKAPTRLYFDMDKLKKLAGDKVYARGQDYCKRGMVELVKLDLTAVSARVSGTENYRTKLSLKGGKIGGECNCPAFEDFGFCKHMVATALTVNQTDGPIEGESAEERIRKWLGTRSLDGLIDLIMEQAERDDQLFKRLDIGSLAASDDGKGVEPRMRKLIEQATKIRGYLDYYEAQGWAEGVGQALESLQALAQGPAAEQVMRLADLATTKIEEAIERIDDSDGYCMGLLEQAREIHLAACATARPNPVLLAQDLFEREMDDEWGHYSGSVAAYADILGADGVAEFRRLATRKWEKLPKVVKGGYDSDAYRLTEMMDHFYTQDGDVEARIALRKRDLSSPLKYLGLAEFCKQQGRDAEAMKYAEDGLWVFEDGHNHNWQLEDFVIAELFATGRNEEAMARLWKRFDHSPSLNLYVRLRNGGGPNVLERAIAALLIWMPKQRPSFWGGHQGDVLVEIHMHERQFDQAWAAAKKHGVSLGMGEKLAKASETSHPNEALQAYAQKVESLVGSGSSNYDEPYKLVKRMAKLRDAAAQAAYVDDLKIRHKRKRNFMKLLG